nr:hypothetical protein [Tanacetum cinerariifolium]
ESYYLYFIIEQFWVIANAKNINGEAQIYAKRIKRLEKKRRSRTHELKRLYKIRLSAIVESSNEEQSLVEGDASKQGRNIADIDADVETTLVDETKEDQGRYDDQEMFDTSVLNDEEEVLLKEAQDVQNNCGDKEIKSQGYNYNNNNCYNTYTDSTRPKVGGVIMQEPSETPTTTTIPKSSKVQDKGKGIMVEEPLKMKKKDQISFDEQEARRLQAEFDEQDKHAEEKDQLTEDENLA